MAVAQNALRTLYVRDELMKKSDENNPLSASTIIQSLRRQGIDADRRSIYSDWDTLEAYGFDLKRKKGSKNPGCYLKSREFNTEELLLIVLALKSSKFITASKACKLTKKLVTLTSANKAKKLQYDIYIDDRLETGGEKIYNNISKIQDAICRNKKLQFEVNTDKRTKKCIMSPWGFRWSGDFHYIVGYNENSESIEQYKVVQMENINMIDNEKRVGKGQYEKWRKTR